VLPVIVEPDIPIALDTMTAMYWGTDAGGDELLPGRVDQFCPHGGGLAAVLSANPLKLRGEPPLTVFVVHHFVLVPDHCAPQKVTDEPTAAF